MYISIVNLVYYIFLILYVPKIGISNYSKYIDMFEYFLTAIVYVRFVFVLTLIKYVYLMRIGLRLSAVDPITASLYRKREMYTTDTYY